MALVEEPSACDTDVAANEMSTPASSARNVSTTASASSEATPASKLPQDLLANYRNKSQPSGTDSEYVFCASQFASPVEAAGALDSFLVKYPPSRTQSQDKEKFIWICASNRRVKNGCAGTAAKLALAKAHQEIAEMKLAFEKIDNEDRTPIRGNNNQGWSNSQRKQESAQRLEKEILPALAKEGGLITGRWLWLRSSESVDQVTRTFATSIVCGPLSQLKKAQVHTLKVACCNHTRNSKHLIALCYDNIWDKEASREVVECLIKDHGQFSPAAIPDLWTVLGITSTHWSTIPPALYNYNSLLLKDRQDALLELFNQHRATDTRDKQQKSQDVSPAAVSKQIGPCERHLSPLAGSSSRETHLPALSSAATQLHPDSPGESSCLKPPSREPIGPSNAIACARKRQGDGTSGEIDADDVDWSAAKVRQITPSSGASYKSFISAESEVPNSPPPPHIPISPVAPVINSSPRQRESSNRISPEGDRTQRTSTVSKSKQREVQKPLRVNYSRWKWTQLGTTVLSEGQLGGWTIFKCPQVAIQGKTLPDIYYAKSLLQQGAKGQAEAVDQSKDSSPDTSSSLQLLSTLPAHTRTKEDCFASLPRSHFTPIHCPLPAVYNEVYDGLHLEELHYGRITDKVLKASLDNSLFADNKRAERALPNTGDPLGLLHSRQPQETRDSLSSPSMDVPRQTQRRSRKTRTLEAERSVSPFSRQGRLRERSIQRSSASSNDPPFIEDQEGSDEEWTGGVTDSDYSSNPGHARLSHSPVRRRTPTQEPDPPTRVSTAERLTVEGVENVVNMASSEDPTPVESSVASVASSESNVGSEVLHGHRALRSRRANGKRRQREDDLPAEEAERPLLWDMSGITQNWLVGEHSRRQDPAVLNSSIKAEEGRREGNGHVQVYHSAPVQQPGQKGTTVHEQPSRETQVKVEGNDLSSERGARPKRQKLPEEQQECQEGGQQQATLSPSSHGIRQNQPVSSSSRLSLHMDAAPLDWDLSNLAGGERMTAAGSESDDDYDDGRRPSSTSSDENEGVKRSRPSSSRLTVVGENPAGESGQKSKDLMKTSWGKQARGTSMADAILLSEDDE